MEGVSVKMANSNISNYLMKRLQSVNNNNSQNVSLFGTTNKTTSASIFSDISLDNLQNFDYESAINALSSGKTDNVNASQNQSLSDIFSSLMSDDSVKSLADANNDGEISAEEGKTFIEGLAGLDGDVSSLSQSDLDTLIDTIGTTTESQLSKLVEEAFKEVEKALEAQKESAANPLSAEMPAMVGNGVPSASNVNSTSSVPKTSSANTSSSSSSSSSSKAKTKTAEDEVEELRKKREEIINAADKNIEAKQKEKDDLVANNSKISTELKNEYASQQGTLKDIQSKKSDAQSSLDGHKASLSNLEADLAALEGEKGALKTDNKDSKVNSENKSRLSELKKSISAKKDKKEKLENKIKNDEAKLKDLEKKEKAQQAVVKDVETQIGQADPKLKSKIDKLNTSIEKLKSEKTKDVAEIDKKIKTKEAEQKKEAKKAGVNKGKASNDIGSGLVKLASKYMGLNEKDGSYKLFTNGRTESWCADFVTYVVKEYAKENGMSVAKGFGSPAVSNLMSWAQSKGVFDNTSKMSNNQKLSYAKNNLSVGDVIIWKSNGASHTGIVKSIGNDGTFTTVEGNSSDQVKSNKKSIYDRSLTGFIKLSDIVS